MKCLIIIIVTAFLMLGGCATSHVVSSPSSPIDRATDSGMPDHWRVAERLRGKLGSLVKLKDDKFMTEEEYKTARSKAIKQVVDNVVITEAEYLHVQMTRIDKLRGEGVLSDEEYQQVRTKLMQQFVGRALE